MEERTGKEEGGLARHSVDCESEIDWDEAKIVACENGSQQRKAREGIESLREKKDGKAVLDNLLTTWQPTI